jgi:hypothetical protein
MRRCGVSGTSSLLNPSRIAPALRAFVFAVPLARRRALVHAGRRRGARGRVSSTHSLFGCMISWRVHENRSIFPDLDSVAIRRYLSTRTFAYL